MAKYLSSIIYVAICIQSAIALSEKSCDAPPEYESSHPCEKKEEFPLNTSVRYCCDAGYRISGSKDRFATCVLDDDGEKTKWNVPSHRCNPVSCSPPDRITNGHIIGSRYTFPNSVEYECNRGYKLRGLKQRYCETSGEWSGQIPKCRIVTCPRPDEIGNGTVSFSSAEYSSVATYECRSGFRIEGQKERTCNHEGVWEGDKPLCIEVVCPEPKDPINGKVTLVRGGIHKNALISYTCNSDTKLAGESFAQCMDDGKWSSDTPICGKPCTIPKLYHGKMGIKVPGWGGYKWRFEENKPRTSVDHGDKILLRCHEDYEFPAEEITPGEDVEVVCDMGALNPKPSCHPAWCRGPLPDNGIGIPPSPPYNKESKSVIEYEDACLNIGTTLQKKTARCYFGIWSVTEARCHDTRCKAKELENLYVDVSGNEFYSNGEIVEVRCKNHYEKSEQTIRCFNGQWEVKNVPCKPAPCKYPPPTIDYGEASVSSGEHGTNVDYRCFPPYELVSQIPVTCNNGQWLGVLPTCNDTRCHTSNLFKYNGIKVEDKAIKDKEFYKPSCLDGYDNLEVEVKCSKGNWQSEVRNPKFCEPGSCTVPFVAYGEFFLLKIEREGLFYKTDVRTFKKVNANSLAKHNSELYFKCPNGMKFQGKIETTGDGIEVTCNMKQWVPKPECWYFPQTMKIAPTTTDQPTEKQIDVNEMRILIPEGTVNNETDEGQYNSTESEIIPQEAVKNSSRNCELKNSDPHLLVFIGNRVANAVNLPHGLDIKFGCQPIGTVRLHGPTSVSCVDGEWEPKNFPKCVPPKKEMDVVILVYGGETYDTYPGDVAVVVEHSRVDIICYQVNQRSWPRLYYNGVNKNITGKNTVSSEGAYFTAIVIKDLTEEYSGTYSCSSEIDSHRISIFVKTSDGSQSIQCPNINTTEHLSIAYDPPSHTILPGVKANFACTDAMWELNGIQSITCLDTGKWSSNTPICVRSQDIHCANINNTGHLSITYDPPSHTILPGVKAYFACTDATWELKGIQSTTCLDTGKWSSNSPICVRRCWPAPEIERGYKEGDSNSIGSEISYTCHRGYRLIGKQVITCKENGLWSNKPPVCSEIRCSVPRKISNGNVDFTSLGFDSEIEYRCNSGYKLKGNITSRCTENEKWSNDPPTCEAYSSRCNSHDLVNSLKEDVFGNNITEEYMPSGSVVKLVCHGDNLIMLGDTYAVCSSKGYWRVGNTQCVSGCYAVKKPDNSSLIIEEMKDAYRFGEDITFSCPENQKLSLDVERIVCLADGWSDDKIPTCVPSKA